MRIGIAANIAFTSRRYGDFVSTLQVNINSPAGPNLQVGTVSFSGYAAGPDTITDIEYQVDGGAWTAFTVAEQWSVDISIGLGNSSVSIRVTDDQLETATDTLNFTAVDLIVPVPGGDGVLSSSVTTSDITVGFTKATDNVYAQSELVYEAYTGDENPLADVDQIKTECQLITSGTDVAELVIPAGQGDLVFFNILVRDPSGNESLYEVNFAVTLDPEVTDFIVFESSVQGDETQTAQLTWDIIVIDGADDGVSFESTDETKATVDALGEITFVDSGLVNDDYPKIRVYPTFYGSWAGTPSEFQYEVDAIVNVYDDNIGAESEKRNFETVA